MRWTLAPARGNERVEENERRVAPRSHERPVLLFPLLCHARIGKFAFPNRRECF
jgi:hypothetical protein